MHTITIGFSPCPNDTFIFDALIHNKIDTKNIRFIPHIADVEELNVLALQGKLQCTKLSFHAFAHCHSHYVILDSGSALGFNNGPLFICKKGNRDFLSTQSRIALPGENTTAHLLFSIAYPHYKNKIHMLFSDIEHAITTKKVDAGVIIHENRFTYAEHGFEKILDLGSFWQQKTQYPIPLGTIAIHKNVPYQIAQTVNECIRESILFALSHKNSSKQFVCKHAQNLTDDIIEKHINLFVNDFSVDLGETGKKAIQKLYSEAALSGSTPPIPLDSLFLNI